MRGRDCSAQPTKTDIQNALDSILSGEAKEDPGVALEVGDDAESEAIAAASKEADTVKEVAPALGEGASSDSGWSESSGLDLSDMEYVPSDPEGLDIRFLDLLSYLVGGGSNLSGGARGVSPPRIS